MLFSAFEIPLLVSLPSPACKATPVIADRGDYIRVCYELAILVKLN